METLTLKLTEKQSKKFQRLVSFSGSKKKAIKIVTSKIDRVFEELESLTFEETLALKKTPTKETLNTFVKKCRTLNVSTEKYLKDKAEEIELEEGKFKGRK